MIKEYEKFVKNGEKMANNCDASVVEGIPTMIRDIDMALGTGRITEKDHTNLKDRIMTLSKNFSINCKCHEHKEPRRTLTPIPIYSEKDFPKIYMQENR